MEYRFLGKSGLKVSALSYGAWVTFGDQVDADLAYRCMSAAFDAGVNFFDNAEAYGGGQAETIMGQVLQRAGWRRSDLVVSTKIFWGGEYQGPGKPHRYGVNDRGLSRKHLVEGTNAALKQAATGLRGPVVLPPARPRHAAGGNRPRHGPPGQPGQGAVLGNQRMVGGADPPGL